MSDAKKSLYQIKSFRARLKRLFNDGLFRWFLVFTIICLVINLTILGWQVRPTDFVVPLQYSTLRGFDGLGAWYRTYTYGLFSLIVTIGNIWLAAIGYDKSRIASFFLVIGALIVNVFTLVVIITLASHLEG